MSKFLGKRFGINSRKTVGKNCSLYKCSYCGDALDLKSYDDMNTTCNKCRYKNNYKGKGEFTDNVSGANNVDAILISKVL